MEEEDRFKFYESQTTRFFRIILHETLQSRKLSFPKSFVQKHGGSLCLDKVYLRVSSGDVWEVEFFKAEDGDLWLHNGWQEFVEFYDIKFGYFLVFYYNGNSEFQVFIFDKTTSEIKYPYKCSNNIGNSDPAPCLLSVKPEIEESDVEMVVDRNACDSDCMFSNNRESTNQIRKGCGDDCYVNGELGNKSRGKAEAIIRTRSFNSPNPYFQILMQATYVNSNFVLHLPGKFIMDHIGRKDCYTRLSVPCGTSWIVKCRLRIRNNRPLAKIQIGWKSFAKDNKLAVGDVCVFELMDSVKVHFRVTIFRAASNPSLSHCSVKSDSRECIHGQISLKSHCHEMPSADIPLEAPNNQTSENPSFKVAMTEALKSKSREGIDWYISAKLLCHEEPSSYTPFEAPSNQNSKYPSFKLIMTEAYMRRHHVPIPKGFLKHLKQLRQDATLEFAGRIWHMKCYSYPHIKQAILARGWRNFAKENLLQAGDVCKFELLDREEMVLKVSIHRGHRSVVSSEVCT